MRTFFLLVPALMLAGACSADSFVSSLDGGDPDAAAADVGAPVACDAGGTKVNCSGNAADGCKVDLQTDRNNCGACGLNCSGGSCAGGVCLLVGGDGGTATTGSDFACLAVDAKNAYWANGQGKASGGAVYRVPTSGGAPILVAGAQDVPHAIASDNVHLFWANSASGEIMRSEPDGKNVSVIVPGQNKPVWMALDATSVYWANAGDGSIWKADKDGNNANSIYAGAGAGHAGPVAVDANFVYFTNGSGGLVTKVPINGGPVVNVATSQIGARGIAVDSAFVYWTTLTAVSKAPLGGGAPLNVASPLPALVAAVAVDAKYAFFSIQTAAGSIQKTPLAGGGAVTTLAANQVKPDCIALDATSIYWITGGGAIIAKTAK